MNQVSAVYRLLNASMFPLNHADIAKRLNMPIPSVRRCISQLTRLQPNQVRYTHSNGGFGYIIAR